MRTAGEEAGGGGVTSAHPKDGMHTRGQPANMRAMMQDCCGSAALTAQSGMITWHVPVGGRREGCSAASIWARAWRDCMLLPVIRVRQQQQQQQQQQQCLEPLPSSERMQQPLRPMGGGSRRRRLRQQRETRIGCRREVMVVMMVMMLLLLRAAF